MSAIVAEREIGYSNLGQTLLGRVAIETPEPDQGDWRCRYRVELPGMNVSRRTAGVDSFQALHLAMQAAVAELATSKAFKAGHLTIFGEPIVTHDDLKQSFGVSRLFGIDQ
jgi:hypothetical protein